MHVDVVTVTIGGQQYHLKPMMDVAYGVEGYLQIPFDKALQQVSVGTSIAQFALLKYGMISNGNKIADADLNAALFADRMHQERPLFSDCLSYAMAFLPKLDGVGTKK